MPLNISGQYAAMLMDAYLNSNKNQAGKLKKQYFLIID